jgi:predicted Fe-Mo cluster-binding NifX family protein
MKIAVASDDQVSIAAHFGRCAGFVIFEAHDGQIDMLGFRENSFGHHQRGTHDHAHDHDHGDSLHSHDGFIGGLSDCEVVICRGMGRRALADLSANGIKPVITAEDVTVHDAATLFSQGRLNWSNDSSCCSH